MDKRKQISGRAPEIILIVQALVYWMYSSPLNPIAIILLLILVFQLIFKNRIAGLVISVLFLVLNLYMCLALASELNEFPSWTENATSMLLVGGTMMAAGLIASTLMVIKWVKALPVTIQTRS